MTRRQIQSKLMTDRTISKTFQRRYNSEGQILPISLFWQVSKNCMAKWIPSKSRPKIILRRIWRRKKNNWFYKNHGSFTFTQESRTKAKSADNQPNKWWNGPMLHCRRKCLLSECLQLDVIYRVQTYSTKININRNSLLTVNYIGFFCSHYRAWN